MAYEWGVSMKPLGPFNGQVFVDEAMHVWEWNGAFTAWMRADRYELRKVRDHALLLANISIGNIFAGRAPTKLASEWDTVYDKSFVELRNEKGGLLGRSAHMNSTQINTWVEALLENDGSKYLANGSLHVFEVFDPNKKQLRWNVWNGLFGSFRGRGAYYGNGGGKRISPFQEQAAGYSDEFQACFFPTPALPAPPLPRPNLEAELFDYFFGSVPALPREGRVCWNSGKRRSMYAIPQNANGTIINFPASSSSGRWAYDHSTGTYVPAQWGDWDIFNQGALACPDLIRQNPCHISRPTDLTGHVLHFMQPRQSMRGVGALCDANYGPIESMLAFCIRSNANKNQTAFLIKPLGVTKCAFTAPAEITTTTHSVMAVGSYDGGPGQNRIINLNNIGEVSEKPSLDGWRISKLPFVVERLRACTASTRSSARSVDNNDWPTSMRLYLRNDTSGVRSEILPGHIKVQHRTNCAPISLVGIR